jgi:hypothetical protein
MVPTANMTQIARRTFLSSAGIAAATILCPPFFRGAARANSASTVAPLEYLVPATDPAFGNRVVKVTDPDGAVPGFDLTWGKVAIHHYSIDQAWNADQTLLALDRGTDPRLFLDGSTYRPVMAPTRPGEVRWHPRRADWMIFVSKDKAGMWNVKTDETLVLNPLADYSEASLGDHKGNPSDDGRLIAITARRSDGKLVIFAYNLETGEKLPDIDVSSEHEVRHTTVSPTGSLIISNSMATSDRKSLRWRIFTTDGQLLQTWTEYERPGHGDLTIDNNGDEVFVGRSKSEPEQWQIIKRRLRDGFVTTLSPPCTASHVSARNLQDPRWVFATFTEGRNHPNFAPYRSEVSAVAIDGSGTVRRLAKTNAVANGYLTEPHGSPSPDGRRAIFASNWGDKDGVIAAYVAEFQ